MNAKFQDCLRAAGAIVRAYRKQAHGDPQNSWVAVAGTVITTGVGIYANQQQQSQAQSGNSNLYGQRFEPVPYEDRIGTEDSYARTIIPEIDQNVRDSLPLLGDIANYVNRYSNQKRDKRTGGAFSQTQRQEGANILAMEQGQIPQDVIDQINRIVAENLGGAFEAGMGGGVGSMTANDSARRIGATSYDIMTQGMSFAPAWRQNVDSFIYKPQDAARDIYFPMGQQNLQASELQLRRDEAEYISANNIARAAALPDPGALGAFRDQQVLGGLQQQNFANLATAAGGVAGAFSKPAGTATTQSWRSNASGVPARAPQFYNPYRA